MNTQCNSITAHCYADNALQQSSNKTTPHLLKRVFHSLAERRRQRLNRSALKDLSALDDDMLKDIGLSRGDVRWASNLPLSTDASIELEIIARRAKRHL